MANIKPLEDRVLVQIVEAETTTASGLVIPDSAKEKPQEATVVAVGPGRGGGAGQGETADIGGDAPAHQQRGEHSAYDAGCKDRT